MLKKILKYIKNLCKKNKGKEEHTKKESTCGKDVILGQLQALKATDIRPGVKVIGYRGLAHVQELKIHPWIRVKYHNGRGGEHKADSFLQYFFSVTNQSGKTKVYQLSYADYEYIHPCEIDEDTWLEGYITNKGYFQLIPEVREQREHLTVFNKSGEGREILKRLKSRNLLTKIN